MGTTGAWRRSSEKSLGAAWFSRRWDVGRRRSIAFRNSEQRPIVAALALRAHHHYGAKEQRELIARPFSSAYVPIRRVTADFGAGGDKSAEDGLFDRALCGGNRVLAVEPVCNPRNDEKREEDRSRNSESAIGPIGRSTACTGTFFHSVISSMCKRLLDSALSADTYA